MAPQHTLTTAPGLTGWTTESITISSGHPRTFRWTNRQPTPARTYGNANRGKAAVYAGTIETTTESTTPAQWDSVRYLAAEANAWLDREFWSAPLTCTADHTENTKDALTAIIDAMTWNWKTAWNTRPKVEFDVWEKPASATTTQGRMKIDRIGNTRPPECFPPSYDATALDLRCGF